MYVDQNVVSHHKELAGVTDILQDSVAHEIQAFSHLALDRLLKAPDSEYIACVDIHHTFGLSLGLTVGQQKALLCP